MVTAPSPPPDANAVAEERRWPAVTAVLSLAALPHLSVVTTNVGRGVDLGTVAAWWLGTTAVSLALVAGVTAWRPRLLGRAATVVAVALYLLFNHPLLTDLRAWLGVPLQEGWWWVVASATVLVVVGVLARWAPVRRFVHVVAPLLLLGPLLQLATAPPVDDVPPVTGDVPELVRTPDVYWFVLDGLAGAPWLRDELGVEVDGFVAELRADGFRLPADPHSNYPLTHVAVASALEMQLLHDGPDEPPARPFFRAIRGDNRTVDTFLANGYDYVHAYPGLWGGSRCGGRETVCIGRHGTLTETQVALLSATPLIELVVDPDARAGVAAANDPVTVVEQVLDAPVDGPTYAFLHLLNPHPPYLRDADCGLRDVSMRLDAWGDGPEYGDAVTCLLTRLEAAVDRILAVDEDPVIVISGDHGPRLGLGADTTGEVVLGGEQFLSAFAAVRLPRACADVEVPDGMTFVNTFRIVFACLTDSTPELVADELRPLRRDYG